MNPPPPSQSQPQQIPMDGGKIKYKAPKTMWDLLTNFFIFMNEKVMSINNSKIFAGIIIITMNIASKFVVFKLSKSMEAYLKYTFSRDILVFAMAWMGTRDIYVALFMTLLFIVCMKYLFNEESKFCCLPEKFTEYHIALEEENEKVSEEQIKQAKEILEKAEKQKSKELSENFQNNAYPSSTQNPPTSILPNHLTKVDRANAPPKQNLLLDEEPYHPYNEQ